jgi:rod shape-determining protein MreB
MRVLDLLRTPLVAIDVGTATTRVSFGGKHVQRPSFVREEVEGQTIVRPAMRAGVVTDVAGVASVLEALLARGPRSWRRPGAVVCAPTDVSGAERDALIESVAVAGASVVAVVPEPLAAAVGSGVDLSSEYATALLDIGEGVTDLALFRGGSVIHSAARRIGCATLRQPLRDWFEFRAERHLVADATLERIVRDYCSPESPGALDAALLSMDEMEALLEPALDEIAIFVAEAVRELPDLLAAEVIESGIHVTGGGAALPRLVQRIESAVRLPLKHVHDPLSAVIRGAGAMLRDRHLLETTRQPA